MFLTDSGPNVSFTPIFSTAFLNQHEHENISCCCLSGGNPSPSTIINEEKRVNLELCKMMRMTCDQQGENLCMNPEEAKSEGNILEICTAIIALHFTNV